jgi:glycosyltransferase involved in cell wall biosynthesis
MKQPFPLVSCICVTHNKPHLLRRAITCFERQTYPNKELVIVYESSDQATASFLQALVPSEGIVPVMVSSEPKLSLGSLRNIGLDHSKGAYISQWDDDDWYHCERLWSSFKFIENGSKRGMVMKQWILYDSRSCKAFLSGDRLWEGSIFCARKELLLSRYEDKALGEDTSVIDALNERGSLSVMQGSPQLYVYTYHGENSWNRDHWRALFECGSELPDEISWLITRAVTGKLSCERSSHLLNRYFEQRDPAGKEQVERELIIDEL